MSISMNRMSRVEVVDKFANLRKLVEGVEATIRHIKRNPKKYLANVGTVWDASSDLGYEHQMINKEEHNILNSIVWFDVSDLVDETIKRHIENINQIEDSLTALVS